MIVFIVPAFILLFVSLGLCLFDGRRGTGWELLALSCLFLSLILVVASVSLSLMSLFTLELGR